MKKNPRNYKRGGAMFAYILDSVYSAEIDTESMTDKERIEFLLDTFFEEKYKNDRRRMCTFDILREWLQGLPSAINVAFNYCDISETGKKWDIAKMHGARHDLWITGGAYSLATFYASREFTELI